MGRVPSVPRRVVSSGPSGQTMTPRDARSQPRPWGVTLVPKRIAQCKGAVAVLDCLLLGG
jgi:hypothetical protein